MKITHITPSLSEEVRSFAPLLAPREVIRLRLTTPLMGRVCGRGNSARRKARAIVSRMISNCSYGPQFDLLNNL